MATEFEIEGKRYRVGKLNVVNQLNLLRKIGPIIAKIAPEFTAMQAAARAPTATVDEAGNPIPLPGADGLADVIKMLSPVFDALSTMEDKDVDYIVRLCLSVTKREEGPNAWMDTWNARAGLPQFTDIELPALVNIAVNVVQENLGSFLGGNPLNTGALGAQAGISP